MLPFAFLLVFRIAPDVPDVKYIQPQMASTGDMIGVTFGTENSVFYAYSRNDGESFSTPVKVPVTGKLSLGRHRGPRIGYQTGNVLISAVTGTKGGGADGDLWVWRSPTNGDTWEKPVRINEVPGSAREGLHAMTTGNGWVLAVWLDLREKGTRIYGARSTDGGRSFGRNFLVYESPDGSVCQCCHPTIVLAAGGAIHVMFRNSLDGSRDIYLATSRDGGQSFQQAKKVGRDTWKLEACPMDGGSIAVTASNQLYTVWRREDKIFVSLPDTRETQLGEGKDPAIASGLNDNVYAVWTGKTGALEMRSTEQDKVQQLAPKGGHPQILFTGHRILAAWEDGAGISIGTVPAPSLRSATEFQ